MEVTVLSREVVESWRAAVQKGIRVVVPCERCELIDECYAFLKNVVIMHKIVD